VTADGLAQASAVNDRMRALLDALDPTAFTKLNQEFHQLLYLPCPNPKLIELVRKGWSELATIRDSTFSFIPERARASVAEHDQLLELIRVGAGAEWIEHCARAHRTATVDAFLRRETESNPQT
jgi:DNA-binding GntR family transcriptional regulator